MNFGACSVKLPHCLGDSMCIRGNTWLSALFIDQHCELAVHSDVAIASWEKRIKKQDKDVQKFTHISGLTLCAKTKQKKHGFRILVFKVCS